MKDSYTYINIPSIHVLAASKTKDESGILKTTLIHTFRGIKSWKERKLRDINFQRNARYAPNPTIPKINNSERSNIIKDKKEKLNLHPYACMHAFSLCMHTSSALALPTTCGIVSYM
ncbi:hypothetical protein EYC80_003923 [Monilinia laxa]|uniref:Uncharacterized protein n=1 Tax=Monilinia laxa TaxID=61186 RepID=A0A5N6KLH5_MONLA|nr:hypothetical protein EYC80_003923 [Monilinia laxa]